MNISMMVGRMCTCAIAGGLVAGAACGSIGGGHRAPDAGGDASTAVPDAAPAARCDPNKPFGAPTLVPSVNSNQVDQGAELIDDVALYFGSSRVKQAGLYVATRSAPSEPFGTPGPLTAINETGAASGPTLTADGLTMYYALVAPGQSTGDLYVTSRPDKAAAFPAGSPVAQVNSNLDDLDPYVTPDGAALYFDSARSGGVGVLDLYVAVRRPDGSFDLPKSLANLNTSVTDGHPVLGHDGLSLYFSSTRSGGLGGTDVYLATRASIAGAFGTPALVPELSSAKNESLSWISADGCVALLQSDRDGGLGLQDIYQAVRPL